MSAINLAAHDRRGARPPAPLDRLILGTGFEYERPDIPGAELDGLYYVRDIAPPSDGTRSSTR